MKQQEDAGADEQEGVSPVGLNQRLVRRGEARLQGGGVAANPQHLLGQVEDRNRRDSRSGNSYTPRGPALASGRGAPSEDPIGICKHVPGCRTRALREEEEEFKTCMPPGVQHGPPCKGQHV